MQTRHHNQFGPGPEDAAPAPRVGLTATKAYTTKVDTQQIQTCGQERNNEENYRGEPQQLLVLQLSVLVTIRVHHSGDTLWRRDGRMGPYQTSLTLNPHATACHPFYFYSPFFGF